MKCEEAQELITGLIDGELSRQESSLVQAHFNECEECPKCFSREHAVKRLIKRAAISIHAPSEVRGKVLHDRRWRAHRAWWPVYYDALPSLRSVAFKAAVLVAILAVPFFATRYWLAAPQSAIVAGLFESYRHLATRDSAPAEVRDLAELRARLTQLVDGQFAPMGYDFSAMNIRPVGGLVQEIANRKVLVVVYRGSGSTIICYTFLGFESDAPEIAELFFDPGHEMIFYQFHYARTNAVMHREGSLTCVLMSQMPMDGLLRLARAKAFSS